MSSFEAPLVKTLQVQCDALGLTVDGSAVVGEAPFAGTVSRVVYVPTAAVTGANTNNRAVKLTNRAGDGTGTTSVASLTFASGTNAAADAEKAITLSGTPANLVVAPGDVLTFDSTHAGTGIADPGGSVLVDVTRS